MRILAILLALTLPLSARPAKPVATPAPATPVYAWSLTAEELAQLKSDIADIQKAGADATSENTALKANLASTTAQLSDTATQLGQAQLETAAGLKNVADLEGQITALRKHDADETARADTAVAEVATLKPEVAKQRGLAWKWRLISLGLVLLFAAYTYARNAIPGLKMILP